MAVSSADIGPAVIVLLVVAFLFVRRIVAAYHGAPVSTARLVGYAVFVLVIFALTVLSAYFAVPWWSFPIDGVVLVLAAYVGARYVQREVVFDQDSAGQWTYKLGVGIPVLYLLLFVGRILIDLFVLNFDPFNGLPAATSYTASTQALLAAVDALFAVSAGLIVGRTFGVLRAFDARKRATAAGPLAPADRGT